MDVYRKMSVNGRVRLLAEISEQNRRWHRGEE